MYFLNQIFKIKSMLQNDLCNIDIYYTTLHFSNESLKCTITSNQ